MEVNKIYQGDALEVLKTIPADFIHMVITSPPYWSLRDYGVEGQIGLEPTFSQYIAKLCGVFDEVKRVLNKTGTCWVNLGDTYSQSGGAGSQYGKHRTETVGMRGHKAKNLPPKCLCLIPSRFAIEMCSRGWVLRNELIWWKPNCLPSSAKDRFTVDFEKLFFFTKSQKYYFEQQLEPHLTKENRHYGVARHRNYNSKLLHNPEAYNSPRARTTRKSYDARKHFYNRFGRNKRAVWSINTKPFLENHFAVFPEELVKTPIKAGCPQKGIVLDPFMGAGTTALAALKLSRRFVGIELNKQYIDIAYKRIKPYLNQEKLTKFMSQ